MNKEVWKDIKGYEGLYQVSNLGNVKSLDRTITRKNGISQHINEKLLSKWIGEYVYVILYKNGLGKTYTIHSLVAEAFVFKGKDNSIVNHKDENKHNNEVSNLEWCNYIYNNNYNLKAEKIGEKLKNGKLSRKVFQYDLYGNLIKCWESTMEIERKLNFKNQSISACCLGKQKTSYGYKWCYEDKEIK